MVNKDSDIIFCRIPVLVFIVVVLSFKSTATDIFYFTPYTIHNHYIKKETPSLCSASLEFLLPQKKAQITFEINPQEYHFSIEYLTRIKLLSPLSVPLR